MEIWREDFDTEEEEELEEEETRGEKKGEEGLELLAIDEVLASEIISDRRLLGMFLALGARPRNAKYLTDLKTYKPVRKKNSYGSYEISYIEVRIPKSTAYKILKRLERLGLVLTQRGIDGRKRYYVLTGLGRKVLEKIKEALVSLLAKEAEKVGNRKAIEKDQLKNLSMRRLGIDSSILIDILGLRKFEQGYRRYYEVP